MMKKILYGMMAATMIFATSCENELELGAAGEEAMVSFTIATPDMGSRVYSDGTTATKLQYAVYDAAGNKLEDLTVTDGEINGSTTVNLQLTTGNTYSVIFWAAAEGAPYTVDFGAKTMTVDYTKAKTKSNDEKRDAFYKYHTFTVNGAQTETIELKRPFAQLNIGTNDYKASEEAGYVPTESSVKVTKIYNTLNFKTGIASGEEEVTFGLAEINKGEKFPVESSDPNAPYKYLAMNYILVNEQDKELVDVEFTYSNGTNAKTRKVGSVPVQRNHRTNIYGQLLTSDVDINIEIKPEYDGAHVAEALFLAAATGGEVTLTEDVVLTTPLEVQANMVLNLANNKLTGSINVANGVELTVNNGAIENTNKENSGIESTGKLTLNNVEITSARHAVRIEGGEAVINGGTYKVAPAAGTKMTVHALNVSGDSKVTIKGGTFIGAKGTTADSGSAVNVQSGASVTIEGGDFSGGKNKTLACGGTLIVKGGSFDQNPAAYLADGYKAIEVAGDYPYQVFPEVVANAAETAGVTSVTESTADVATALATNNGEATMFMWNDVAYIAKYGEVIIASSADNATTVRGVVEYATDLKSATVKEGVEVVGNRTFRKCAELVTVELPNTLNEIGPAVFQSCSKLANVNIPASVTTIGEGAFAECTSLTSINIPDGVTRLEKDVLRNTGLVSIEIPASVNYIGTYAFRDCESLTEVKILSPEFTIENNTFTNMAAPVPTMTIYVVNAEMKAYLESVLTNYDKSYITVVVM